MRDVELSDVADGCQGATLKQWRSHDARIIEPGARGFSVFRVSAADFFVGLRNSIRTRVRIRVTA
jgi:hypothetical protein